MRTALCALALLAAGACTKPAAPPPRPPHAEFLLASGDSTYWIRSAPEGVRVRSAPILLTRADNHFYELYVTDDVRDYEDASFASARAFRRDISESDSLLIYEEGTVQKEARAWERTHPRAQPVNPDDLSSDDAPPTLVADDIEVVDVHGPWLTFAHVLDVDVAGRRTHLHRKRRGVLDIRTGVRSSLNTLFGPAEAARLRSAALHSLAELQDSVKQSSDARGTLARQTLASFTFDSLSFSLTDIDAQPAVSFMVPGTGAEGEALSIFLPAVTAASPTWWADVSLTLPKWNADSSLLLWSRAGYDVIARPSQSGDVLFISLAPQPATANSTRWAIAAVSAPAYQLIPLDAPAIDSATRSALARAFDQSSALNGNAKRAGLQRRLQFSPPATSVGFRPTTLLACPTKRVSQSPTSTPRFAFRVSGATSSACSRSHLAYRYKAR